MEIVSINTGRRRHLEGRSFNGETGIFKEPAAGAVRVARLGLEGDEVVHTAHHGGPDQAVYVYRLEDYQWWETELGRELAAGTFGENLTIAGLPSPDAVIGSRLVFETVVLEVTAPRIPCALFATRMGDPAFARSFIAAERPGLYCRVIEPGELVAGECFEVQDYAGAPVTIVEMYRDWHRKLGADEIRRYLAAPMAVRAREYLQEKLAQMTA